ncbi:rhodanese-like domain-containing protein [Nonlabens sp.]|uniref:rhodanese-like domain-containing protein n=1 Tax=Nonlabens sp. TaxID=1888209 RepID=UPI003F699EAE
MKTLLILMSFFSSLFGGNTKQIDTITVLDKAEFKNAIAHKVQLVDVRTPNEYASGHIKNAINIDFFNQTAFVKAFEKLDKEKPVYIYCKSGNRSNKAAQKLDSLGFKNIYDLRGGYMNWN